MQIGFYQLHVVFGDKQTNLKKVHQALTQRPFNLVVLPELFNTGCLFTSKQQVHNLAESIPDGETTQMLLNIARIQKAYIIGGIVEKEGERLYNTAVLVGPHGVVGKHRKVHLSTFDAGFFTPGTCFEVFEVFDIRVGILLCYDCWFPETGKALMAKQAHLICIPVNLCGEDGPEIIRQRSQEWSVYTITANRLGMDHTVSTGVSFLGASQIVNPEGVVTHRADNRDVLGIEAIDFQKTC